MVILPLLSDALAQYVVCNMQLALCMKSVNRGGIARRLFNHFGFSLLASKLCACLAHHGNLLNICNSILVLTRYSERQKELKHNLLGKKSLKVFFYLVRTFFGNSFVIWTFIHNSIKIQKSSDILYVKV